MNTQTKIIIILTSIFLVTISYFLIVDSTNLGENYFYLTPDEGYDIGYPGGAIVYKSTKKNVFSEIIIKSEVVGLDYDDKYIIALQRKDSVLFQFYIIEKKTDSLFGPYMRTEYNEKRAKLGLPEGLDLNKHTTFSKNSK
jgi:hypothetical protein